jgi:hypothetical protein
MKNNIRYVKKDEDSRDYKVRFDKIKSTLGFETAITVPNGIDEIIDVIDKKIIDNPDDTAFKNL